MATVEMKVPPVGESISEVTIGSWMKKDGDVVKRDEIICSLDSDKASFEVAAESDGILQIKVQEGETIPIGTLICVINGQPAASPPPRAAYRPDGGANSPKSIVDSPQSIVQSRQLVAGGEPLDSGTPPDPKSEVQSGTPLGPESSITQSLNHSMTEMLVPAVGESISEVTIASWNKKDGDFVKVDEVICTLESDKASFELPAEASGTLKIIAQEGETIPIGALVCVITAPPAPSGGANGQKSAVGSQQSAAGGEPLNSPQPVVVSGTPPDAKSELTTHNSQLTTGFPSPAAAKILAEKGVEPSSVQGSGVGGRITKEDAVNVVVSPKPLVVSEQPSVVSPKPVTQQPNDSVTKQGQRREKMSSLRKTIARRLVAVKNETAMLTTFNEVDMKPIMELRAKYKDKFKEKHAVGLGFMSFFTKAVCLALQEFPVVNAYIDGDEIVYNADCDVSIAVSAPRGLVVPVIRAAQKMSFAQVEAEVVRLATLAKENKLTIDQMQGGTFTITNGGIFGSMLSTPIINAPQAAILGMHNIVERAVVVNGEIVIRPIMYVALSYDHRTIDGKDSVGFLVRVKQLLEDPTRLLLEV